MDTQSYEFGRGGLEWVRPSGLEGVLEIVVGAIEPEGGGRRCFAAPVSLREQSLAVAHDAIAAASRDQDTTITALTGGAVLMRHCAREMGAADIPISDWLHISMRIRHIEPSAAVIDDSHPAVAKGKQEVIDALERMRHRLWNGHKTAARDASRAVRAGLKEHPDEPMRKGRAQRNRTIRRAMSKMVAYLANPQARLVNYAERHRVGERVATSLVEGGADQLVNARMARTQHMCWSERGAFNILQLRVAQFNQRLAQQPIAARSPHFQKGPPTRSRHEYQSTRDLKIDCAYKILILQRIAGSPFRPCSR